jgi:hypothetical protein
MKATQTVVIQVSGHHVLCPLVNLNVVTVVGTNFVDGHLFDSKLVDDQNTNEFKSMEN